MTHKTKTLVTGGILAFAGLFGPNDPMPLFLFECILCMVGGGLIGYGLALPNSEG